MTTPVQRLRWRLPAGLSEAELLMGYAPEPPVRAVCGVCRQPYPGPTDDDGEICESCWADFLAQDECKGGAA